MTCHICDGKVFSLKYVTIDDLNGEVTYLSWICDNCDEPAKDDIIHENMMNRLKSWLKKKKSQK